VRLALGAEPAGITRRIVLRGLAHAVAGSAIGVGLALLLTDRTRGLLYGVSPRDAGTYLLVGAVLLASAMVASWIPARRAARIRPMEAIAAE
jgi:ABC-type lipoprotein release transport system permease subunit